jgi:hypothetical protein
MALDLQGGGKAVNTVLQAADFVAQFGEFRIKHSFLFTAAAGWFAGLLATATRFLPAMVTAAGPFGVMVPEVDAMRTDAVGHDAEFVMAEGNVCGGKVHGLRSVVRRNRTGAEMIVRASKISFVLRLRRRASG